ncbi:hypothetical protein QMK33_06320 [Hymenobacter sp. H14-R3]|uniref:hypothetical protein n=1 Tax=Hymenobacter sp. H14-R3 TaxID=3046308 RepID=UPI0024BB7D93|nr:hypothetical protein [Hymenobacter sp. H14-R3]MDJ0364760.1 hypothetical protein [Hymenobacter sp. H14-R3]
MLTPTTYSPESFTIEHRPEQHLLIGRWLRPVPLQELQTHYEAMLEAALAHNSCWHWLLDVRRRPYRDAAAAQWFGEVYAPRLPQVLGQPVVIAYFAMVSQDVASEDDTLRNNMAQGSLQGSRYCYFNQEGEALAWLTQQP